MVGTKFRNLRTEVDSRGTTRDFFARPVDVSFNLLPGQNPTDLGKDSGIKIFEPNDNSPEDSPEAEKYFNGETAFSRLYLDEDEYRIIPNKGSYPGNAILRCDNTHGLTACNTEGNSPVDTQASLTDIGNFNVQCGDEILYGWTVLKCIDKPLDLVFVVDTSSTMLDNTDNKGVKRIVAAKAILQDFVENQLASFNNINQIGLVSFNRDARVELRLTPKENTYAILDILSDPNRLQNQEFTEIDEGLALTDEVFTNANTEKVIILITDGGVNPCHTRYGCPPLDPQNDARRVLVGEQKLYDIANRLKNTQGRVIISMAIGNDSDKVTFRPDILGKVASCIDGSDCPSNDQFRYNDPNLGLVLEKKHYLSNPNATTVTAVVDGLIKGLNTCNLMQANFVKSLKSKDVNGDGIINSVDLFLIFDNYFAQGENIPEDVNSDGIVNSLDVTEIFADYGTVVPTETK